MRPPRLIIEADKEHRVIFESLALMDGHQRNLLGTFISIKRGGPSRGASCTRSQMRPRRLDHNSEKIAGRIFGMAAPERRQIKKGERVIRKRLGTRRRRWRLGHLRSQGGDPRGQHWLRIDPARRRRQPLQRASHARHPSRAATRRAPVETHRGGGGKTPVWLRCRSTDPAKSSDRAHGSRSGS